MDFALKLAAVEALNGLARGLLCFHLHTTETFALVGIAVFDDHR